MATEVLTLEIATPVGLALATECESIEAPSAAGEFGVFPGHLPLLASLKAGVIRYEVGGETRQAAVGPGFVEAGSEKVLLLTECFALAREVDGDAVRAELKDAEKRLEALEGEYAGIEYDEISRAIDWAHARLALLHEP